MTAQANVTEILSRANSAVTPKVTYDLGKVPTTPPSEYGELTLTRRFGGVPTIGGQISTTGYRFTLAAVSRVSVANVRNLLEKYRAEFEFTRLVIGSETSTPIQFETEDVADYGAGNFAAYMAFTFAI